MADFQLLTDAAAIQEAENLLLEKFRQGATYEGPGSAGFQGGSQSVPIIWHEGLSLWGSINGWPEDLNGRFWNGFGTSDPRAAKGISIVCEVNPPKEGVNPQVAGAFAVDIRTGHRLLLHRGRIGGGKAGIGAQLFFEHVSLPVIEVGEPSRNFVLVADLDAPEVPSQIAQFVHEVSRIKALADPSSESAVPGVAVGKYQPLTDWLRQKQSSSFEVQFSEIEELVGLLPSSARSQNAYWLGRAAASPTHSWKRAWEAAGFTVVRVDRSLEVVVFRRLDDNDDFELPSRRFWWVNQGITYGRELAGGYLWAPVRAKNGFELSHHRSVSELSIGDWIFHYSEGHIRAVSKVIASPELARKPDEITEEAWEGDGRLARVEYFQFSPALPLERFPIAWRIEERGPFNSTGRVNQVYLVPLTESLVQKLASIYPEVAEILGLEPELPEELILEIEHNLETIGEAMRDEGLRIDDRTLRRFHLALSTRGFVILSGISGTGKTWLAQAYARATRGPHLLVPVASNWTTNEDLLGYLNPLDGLYRDTAFSRFIREAAAEWRAAAEEAREARPYFLILDEMNLARVEYYMSQFLSALEVRAREGIGRLFLGEEELEFGPNLKFVGTVNVDETTHGFADKVYDRAQIVELAAPREAIVDFVAGEDWAPDLLAIWEVVHDVAPFAFRVIDEFKTYLRDASKLGVDPSEAFDEQILQKVLPKFRGLHPRAGDSLESLLIVLENRFPLSHAKANQMLSGFRQHGVVSYFT